MELLLVPQTVLLLVLAVVQLSAAEQCKCSDIQCLAASANSSNECCLWDFPGKGAATTLYEEMGFAYGRTTADAPRFCITYPIAEYDVAKNNYFVVTLDLAGPAFEVCIYEPGKTENKSCSSVLHNIPVSKAIYCPGVPAIGAESVNFSIECTDCADYDTTFQFRVYSESFNTTQEQWCEGVDTTVPSEVVHTHKPPPNVPSLSRPTEEGEEESAVSGENRTNAENYENTKDDNNNSGAIATVPAFVLSISVVILAGLLQ